MLDRNKIVIKKNSKSGSLFEDKFGACVYMKLNNKFVVVQGIFKDDILNISRNIPFVEKKYKEHMKAMSYNLYDVQRHSKQIMKILNLRDMIACSTAELCDELKRNLMILKEYKGKPLLSLINEFFISK